MAPYLPERLPLTPDATASPHPPPSTHLYACPRLSCCLPQRQFLYWTLADRGRWFERERRFWLRDLSVGENASQEKYVCHRDA